MSEDGINSVFDNSPPDGVPGILVGFIEGEAARRWHDRPEQDVRQKMPGCFAGHFGERARAPQHFYYANWGRDPWSRGCYCGVPTPGTWTGYQDALRKPVGRIHWAGTEASTQWAQYMEGGSTIWAERIDRHLIEGEWHEIPVMGILEMNASGQLTLMREYFDPGLAL